MYTRVLVITSLSSLLTPTTLAQQSCYWPDGSSPPASDGYVDCYLNQDSHCCLSRDACLSNGLCYGSTYGWTYRGACTVKDWSNTTACPIEWCNDIHSSGYANLWMCPPVNHGASPWWCGNSTAATPCQNVNSSVGHFVAYTTGGTVLGLPPVTSLPSSSSARTTDARATTAPITTPAAPSNQIASATVVSSTSSPSSSKPPQTYAPAIGVGIGVPLGIAVIGCLVFLFWREQRRRVIQKPIRFEPGMDPSRELVGNWAGRRSELPDSQVPGELDHGAAKVEISGR